MTGTEAELTASSSLGTLTLPTEVHVFEVDGRHYAFDVRSFSILQLDAAGAKVLERVDRLPLDAIVDELDGEVPAAVVRAHYLRYLQLIDDGTLSSAPVPRPARPPFNRLVLMLAGGCNMGCSYCFEKDVPIYQNPNRLSVEQADETLDWFFRHQEGPTAHVQLYGGEPTLNWDVLQYVVVRMETWAAENGKELTKYMITNGTLLDPERVAWLKAHEVSVQVSVDGDEATHDRFRLFKSGKPTLGVIKPNIAELARQEADFNLRAVMTRENTDPRAVTDGLRRLGADRVSFEVVATDDPATRFTGDDWDAFGESYRSYLASPLTTWNDLPDEMKSVIINICGRQRIFYGCGAGISEVTVAPDGSIYECQRIYRTPYSNVGEDRSPTDLASELLTMVDDRPICQDCWARYLCGGGCMHQSHTEHGTDDPVPQYCTNKRALVEAAVVKIEALRARAATTPAEPGQG